MYSNLDTLKREILETLRGEEYVLFHGNSHSLEEEANVFWDTERNPDYNSFLAAARKLGVKLIIFSEREFRSAEVDELVDELEDCELDAEEQRGLERRIRDLRVFEGRTCALRLGFHFEGRGYVFELRTDWFDEYLETSDEIAARMPDDDEDEDDGSLGGYYSNN